MSEPKIDPATLAAAQKAIQAASQELYELLIDAERAYRNTARMAEKHRRLRNDIVRTAARAGVPQSEIAAVIDLSRARIAQIVDEDDGS